METDITKLEFPRGFLWGASTSSHQVEGGNHNDWSEWERENATRLAREARSIFGHLSNWTHIEKEATDPNNYISGIAANHFNRYKEDLELAKELGHNVHRFSLEWSRIEPEEGKFDQSALGHYREVIKSSRERGLEPFVTLWHWTLPLWLSKKGGIEDRQFSVYFERYTEKVVRELGSQITFWITLNEPEVVASHGYLKGVWPPQKKSIFSCYQVMKTLIKTHKLAYKKIKAAYPRAQIGIAKHQVAFEVYRSTFLNSTLKKVADYFWNSWYLNQIENHQDFIGVNSYHRNMINNGYNKNPNKRVTDFGWEFAPTSIYQVLVDLKSYNKPIYITENGLADADDSERAEFIREALGAVSRAIKAGADVRGYLHWSLLDNFEWDKGYWPRFGLIEVDRVTMERRIRSSAFVYRDYIKQNTL